MQVSQQQPVDFKDQPLAFYSHLAVHTYTYIWQFCLEGLYFVIKPSMPRGSTDDLNHWVTLFVLRRLAGSGVYTLPITLCVLYRPGLLISSLGPWQRVVWGVQSYQTRCRRSFCIR